VRLRRSVQGRTAPAATSGSNPPNRVRTTRRSSCQRGRKGHAERASGGATRVRQRQAVSTLATQAHRDGEERRMTHGAERKVQPDRYGSRNVQRRAENVGNRSRPAAPLDDANSPCRRDRLVLLDQLGHPAGSQQMDVLVETFRRVDQRARSTGRNGRNFRGFASSPHPRARDRVPAAP